MGDYHPDLERLEYWIFDFKSPNPMPTEKRIQVLEGMRKTITLLHPESNVVIINSQVVSRLDYSTFTIMRGQYEDLQFEGMMIKQCSDGHIGDDVYRRSLYKSGRSINTLKYKQFDLSTCTVINVVASKKRTDLAVLVVEDCDRKCVFGLHYGTEKEKKEWLLNPSLIIGTILDYEHKGYTDDGLPSFPTVATGKSAL